MASANYQGDHGVSLWLALVRVILPATAFVNVAGITAYVFAMFAASAIEGSSAEGIYGNIALAALAAIGSTFGGIASMSMRKKTKWNMWDFVRLWTFSAVSGMGATPLILMYAKLGYSPDVVITSSFFVALMSETVATVGLPAVRRAIPAMISAFLRVNENGTAKVRRNDAGGTSFGNGDSNSGHRNGDKPCVPALGRELPAGDEPADGG